jgi:hypothetical protein
VAGDDLPMKLLIVCGIAAVSAGFAIPAQKECQPSREMRPTFRNLNFTEGAPGNAPPEWYLGPEWFNLQMAPGHKAKTVSGSACHGGKQCATVYSIGKIPSSQRSFLYQVVDAAQYRGKTLTYRAAVRVASGSAARLLVNVHRTNCESSFRDDMGDHPITASGWSSYRIKVPIGPDARDIEFGIQLVGNGAAWIDNITMTLADAK